MACVGVAQGSALGFQDGVEAGYEHVLGDTSRQRLVDLREYLSRREGSQDSSYCPKHRTACTRRHSSRHAFTGSVSYCHSYATFAQIEEVVEVSSYLPGWLVVRRDLPALQLGHLLGERGLLDTSCHHKLLLHALALAYLLL